MAEDPARMGDDLERLHERIAAVLGPRRKQLTEAVMAEIEQEAIDRMAAQFVDETRIKSMDFRNGAHMDIEPAREIVAAWVAAARAMLGDAPNYCETEIDYGLADPPGYEMDVKLAGEVDHYVFRVQRRGKLTPHQARQAAEAERDQGVKLLEEALHLRVNGERAPGAPHDDPEAETWRDWTRKAEEFLWARMDAVTGYTPPEPIRMPPETEHLARYCSGSRCRSPFHNPPPAEV